MTNAIRYTPPPGSCWRLHRRHAAPVPPGGSGPQRGGHSAVSGQQPGPGHRPGRVHLSGTEAGHRLLPRGEAGAGGKWRQTD